MKLGVLTHPDHAAIPGVVDRVRAEADRLGIELVPSRELDPSAAPALEEALDELDALLTLGGDGTLLRGARMAGPRDLPVLGCNLGRLGFLTAAPIERLEEALERLVDGTLVEERRLALKVEVIHGGEAGVSRTWYALNDAVVHKGGFARLIQMRVRVDEEEMGQISADGFVIATATGSTAYSLSAGGPILVPSLDALVATPISPHTLAVRPVVVPADSQITVEIASRMGGILVTVDGQAGARLGAGDRVQVRRSPHPVRTLRLPEITFFSVLRQKLRWGDVRPSDA